MSKKDIKIALIGNPNTGKTSVFNADHPFSIVSKDIDIKGKYKEMLKY